MDKFVVVKEAKNIDNNESTEENDLEDWVPDRNIPVDPKEIKMIRDFIEKKMNNTQKVQIVDMIKSSNYTKYTINKNGYFINMNNIPNEILKKIKMFVDFTKENAKELQKTEDILNEEKTRIENIDKIEEDPSHFSGLPEDNFNEKNINFEIYTIDASNNSIFDEYIENDDEESEFCDRFLENEKRENSGYKIILKRYKKKYFGNKAKVLKKFRDISRTSINSKSAKTSLTQNPVKPVAKPKSKKKASTEKNKEDDDEEEIECEDTQSGGEEYTYDEE